MPFSALFLAYIRVGADIMSRKSDVQNELVALIQALLILFVTAEAFLSGWEHRREVKESLAAADTALPATENRPATASAESVQDAGPAETKAESAEVNPEVAPVKPELRAVDSAVTENPSLPEPGKEEA